VDKGVYGGGQSLHKLDEGIGVDEGVYGSGQGLRNLDEGTDYRKNVSVVVNLRFGCNLLDFEGGFILVVSLHN